MNLKTVTSYSDMMDKIRDRDRTYVLLYKEGSWQSDCARKNIESITEENVSAGFYLANVNEVRDIHPHFHVTTVPTLLEFDHGEFKNNYKGCHQPGFYQNLLNQILFEAKAAGRPQKRVTVYSTPTCPWCNTLKAYLRKNGVRFTDIDVSRDQQAASDMIRKSGQQGVPQTDINGEMIIGFDQNKLSRLLEIKTI